MSWISIQVYHFSLLLFLTASLLRSQPLLQVLRHLSLSLLALFLFDLRLMRLLLILVFEALTTRPLALVPSLDELARKWGSRYTTTNDTPGFCVFVYATPDESHLSP